MNDSESWRRLLALFDELCELDSRERERRLEHLSRTDSALVGDLRRMLEADEFGDLRIEEGLGAFLSPDSLEVLPGDLPQEAPDDSGADAGRQIGPWRLVRRIGRGGMGEVWEAKRNEGDFEQTVALKLLKRGIDTEDVLARFLRERRLLARLQHPNIARFFDGGSTEDGRPWFAMELMEGREIASYCDVREIGLEERLRLFLKVCDAVEFAHRNLVIHRDLKPSNVVVGSGGEVKLLDFGIAKLLEGDEEGLHTRTGLRLLTPSHAAPEQIVGGEVTLATDVYALGVLLYQLLTGRLPHERQSSTAQGLMEAVLRETVARPSSVVRQTASQGRMRGIAPERLSRRLAGDLDVIALKAMAHSPDRRYPTVNALAEDIRRHLEGLPILARPDSVSYRLGKFARRHRAGVLAGAVISLSIFSGAALAVWQAREARSAQLKAEAHARQAVAEAQRAERVRQFLVELFVQNDPLVRAGVRPKSPEDLLADAVVRIDREFGADPEMQAELLDEIAQIHVNTGRIDAAEPLAIRAFDLRQTHVGPRTTGAAESLVTLGGIALSRGDLDRAHQLLSEAEEIYEENEGRESWDVANVLGGLAQILVYRGEVEEALGLLQESYDIARRLRDDADVEVNMRLHNLATGLFRLRRYEEALDASSRAKERLEPLLGVDHPRLVFVNLNMGSTLAMLDRDAEARALLLQALDAARSGFGEHHFLIGRILLELGQSETRLGEHSAAEERLMQARGILQASRPVDEPRALLAIAELRLRQERPAEAAPLFQEAAHLFSERLGPDHPQGWQAALGQKLARARAGEAADAVASAREAAVRLAPLQTMEGPDAIISRERLEEIYSLAGHTLNWEQEFGADRVSERGDLEP